MPHRDDIPPAAPHTQSEPVARGGGTYGQGDFSRSAQSSRFMTERKSDLPGEAMDRPAADAGPAESDTHPRNGLTDSRRPAKPG